MSPVRTAHTEANADGGARPRAVSRRAFLGLGALAAAGAAAAAVGGCAPSASVDTEALDATSGGTTGTSGIAANDTTTPSFLQIPDQIPDSSMREILDAEVVVVGAGLSGLTAARAAVEAGIDAEGIVVVEKAESYQCRSSLVGTVGGPVQEGLGIAIDGTAVVAELMKVCGYRPNQRILKLWADYSAEALEWFLAPCEDYVIEEESAPYDGESLSVRQLHWPHPEASRTENDYYPIFDTCQILLPSLSPYLRATYDELLDAGVHFMFSTWARQLVRGGEERDGRIEAVIVEGVEGNYRKLNVSRAVLLATGDYGSNTEMMQYYTRWAARLESTFPNADAKGEPTNTGDGQRMGMWVGARMEPGPHATMTPHTGGPLGVDGFLLVDRRGRRFVNEDVGGQQLQNQISRLPGRRAWQIFDAKWKNEIGTMDAGFSNVNWFVESGADVPSGQYYGRNPYIAPDDSKDGFTRGFDSYFEEGGAGVTADTIEELAELMEVDEDELADTVARYNELAAAGTDLDFGKRADRLFPLTEPPFYAYPFEETSLLVCLGGLMTDEQFAVLDAATNEPIEGLYAVGNCQGGRFAVDYPLTAPGISHGMAITHGMLVGRVIAGERIELCQPIASDEPAEGEGAVEGEVPAEAAFTEGEGEVPLGADAAVGEAAPAEEAAGGENPAAPAA